MPTDLLLQDLRDMLDRQEALANDFRRLRIYNHILAAIIAVLVAVIIGGIFALTTAYKAADEAHQATLRAEATAERVEEARIEVCHERNKAWNAAMDFLMTHADTDSEALERLREAVTIVCDP